MLFDTSSSLTSELKPRTLNERESKRQFWGEKEQRQLTRESDWSHPCVRECLAGVSKVCYYALVVDWHSSMSVQCGDCPYNLTSCDNPGCIVGGGIVRPVISANRRTPGPAILVCENDTVIVDVTNVMDRELLTVHWHGLHQVGSQYMDGAPYITQCPITPGDSFRYEFLASPHGTHIWHGHVGFHDASGLFGPLIVRRPEPDNISSLYDYDLPEHTVSVWHWYNESDSSVLPPVLDTYGKVYGYGLLINGQANFGKFQSKTNTSEFITTPRAKFYVNKGKKYRFRILANAAIYCPVQMSIDNHTLTVIASDTSAVQPFEVDSLVLSAGERFSFVLAADQEEDCYWIRFRGMGDCDQTKSSTHGEAFLCYNGSLTEPSDTPTYEQARRPGRLLNPVEQYVGEDYSKNNLTLFSELTAAEAEWYSYNGTADVTLYIALTSKLYYEADAPGPWHLFNGVRFESMPFSMLTQRALLSSSSSTVCDEPASSDCIGNFCSCTLTKKVPLNALVEIVMVDTDVTYNQDHPIHMHGYKYYVVAMDTVGINVSMADIEAQNEQGLLAKQLTGAPATDTITVPSAGYVVLRFRASNPGFWFFHCHVTNHLVMGMAMVLQVGEVEEMVDTPPDFPTCSSALYDAVAAELSSTSSGSSSTRSLIVFTLLCIYCQLLRINLWPF